MTTKVRAVRVVSVVVGTVVSLMLVALVTVQIQQRTLRWRAERLSADMHTIRLYQSTWADAQRLMDRWGEWGHYDGSCTAESCQYAIKMGSITSILQNDSRHPWLIWLLRHDRLNLYQWFGGRTAVYFASFTVHSGTIWRQETSIGVDVPRRRIKSSHWGEDNDWEDLDKSISVGAGSFQRLHRTVEGPPVFMGGAEQLVGHPYYKVGRPGGCMLNCQIGVVYYSTHTPPVEIDRLTSYDFSCFTRFNPCTEIEDLLPAAKAWHLYKENEVTQSSVPEKLCDVPVWALARDARYVLAIEVLSRTIERGKQSSGETAQVRVIRSLKEAAPWLPGSVVRADVYSWLRDSSRDSEDQHLIPGRRYLVFPIGDDSSDRMVKEDSPLTFDRCGVQDDTPEARRELEQGFAQNDTLGP